MHKHVGLITIGYVLYSWVVFNGFLMVFRQTVLAYGFLNILYNEMKETKRVVLKLVFFLHGFQGNLCVLCECHCLFLFLLKNLCALLHLNKFKTYYHINMMNSKNNNKAFMLKHVYEHK